MTTSIIGNLTLHWRPCPLSVTTPTHSHCGVRSTGAAVSAFSSQGTQRPRSPQEYRHASSPQVADSGSAQPLSGFRTCMPATRRCRLGLAPLGAGLKDGVKGKSNRQGHRLQHVVQVLGIPSCCCMYVRTYNNKTIYAQYILCTHTYIYVHTPLVSVVKEAKSIESYSMRVCLHWLLRSRYLYRFHAGQRDIGPPHTCHSVSLTEQSLLYCTHVIYTYCMHMYL